MEIKIKYLDNYKWVPMKYSKFGDACFDARAAINTKLVLKGPRLSFLSSNVKIFRYEIPLGFKVEIPEGYEMQIRMRSGLTKGHGLIMSNGVGTIDCGYRGEVRALVSNLGNHNFIVKPGDRIVQCKIAIVPKFKLVTTNELSVTDRGEGGFGSTGI